MSGAKGGPSTSRGMNYQVAFAVEQTLDYIARALCAPLLSWEVRLEPRVSSLNGLTNWDVGFNPGDLLFEIKLKPAREDVQDWIQRVVLDASVNRNRSYHLVFSTGAGKHLDRLDQLLRIAVEANGNKSEFESKLTAESIDADDPYLVALGPRAHELLQRMYTEQVPAYMLKSVTDFRARQLAGEEGGRRLRDFLFTKFHESVPHRITFSILDLIWEARSLGIDLRSQPYVTPGDISQTATAALIILQGCKTGLPASVIATTVNSSTTDVESELQELRRSHAVSLQDGLWSMRPLATEIRSGDQQDVLARSLSSLLAFIEATPDITGIREHIDNVVALAKRCMASHPSLVASVFTRLDKRLKRIGNKRLVWFVAHLSIQAARGIRERDREVVEHEARALICGTSWAFQRLHKIGKARIDADEAYRLAQNMRMDRTLAFCVKCRGRLCRMEAEQMTSGPEKMAKLHESVALLNEAIEHFGLLTEFGPEDPEVGDCFSLLGRTYLELNDLTEAENAIQRAKTLLIDESSKDFIDLLILKGDVEVAKGNRRAAFDFYNRAAAVSTTSDPEISEMRARALFKRAKNRDRLGDKLGAKTDYQEAERIYESIHDEQFKALASWERIRLSKSVSDAGLTVLTNECDDVRVRVEAVNLHIEELELIGQQTVARRSEPPHGYWRQLVRRANERVVLRGEHSETDW